MDQYKEAVYTLNKELIAMLTKLQEETYFWEESEKVKTNLMTKLIALCE